MQSSCNKQVGAWRSTVQSLPLQLVFPDGTHNGTKHNDPQQNGSLYYDLQQHDILHQKSA